MKNEYRNNYLFVTISAIITISVFIFGIYILVNYVKITSSTFFPILVFVFGCISYLQILYKQYISKIIIDGTGITQIEGKEKKFLAWENIKRIDYKGNKSIIINERVTVYTDGKERLYLSFYRQDYKKLWELLYNEVKIKNNNVQLDDSFLKRISMNDINII